MAKVLNIIIGIALLLSIISCEDDAVSQFRDNIIKVQLLDSVSNQPIRNQTVSVYYGLEKTANTEVLYECFAMPNPIFEVMAISYYLHNKAKVRITLNNVKDYSIIKELYKSDTLEIEDYRIFYDTKEFTSGFYMLQFYFNGVHTNNMKILIAKDCFVILDNYPGKQIGNPYLTLVSDNDGIISVDMDKFKDIGTQIQRIMETGDDRGVYEVINGFHCITSIPTTTVSKQYSQTVRTAECKDKQFVWKISK